MEQFDNTKFIGEEKLCWCWALSVPEYTHFVKCTVQFKLNFDWCYWG